MCLPLAVCAQHIIYDKDAERRQVGDFHSIEVSHAVDLRLSSGNENALAVSAPNASARAAIHTEVSNGVLKIWFDSNKWFRNKGRARIYVSAKSLQHLSAFGACDVNIIGEFNTASLSIDLSGASDLTGSFKTNSLKVQLSGASDMYVKGATADMTIQCSGASKFKGYKFNTDNCDAHASGASDIKVAVNKAISASASGASKIFYTGNARATEIKTSGAGKVQKQEG